MYKTQFPNHPWKVLSFVHEQGVEKEDNPTPYDHTHILVYTHLKRLDFTNVRALDMPNPDVPDEPIHPHMNTRKSMLWVRHLCMKYHKGHKVDKQGKKYYEPPIFLHQDGVEDWKFEEDLWDQVAQAPSLKDACMIAESSIPKSINDVKAIRAGESSVQPTKLSPDVDPYLFRDVVWHKRQDLQRPTCLVLRGPPGIGKSEFALHLFKRPHMVCEWDDLKNLPAYCDGIVFDDMNFSKMTKQNQINLTDIKRSRPIKCRYVNGRIPEMVSRVFTCNVGEDPFEGCDSAVLSRLEYWDVTNLYTPAATQ
jgi:hypothetical protein